MRILTNTNLHSGGGIARRANEMIRYCEEKGIPLVVIGITKEKPKIEERGSVKIYHLTVGKGVNCSMDIYRGLRDINDLERRLKPTIKEIQEIMKDERIDVVLSEGTFYAPWMIYKASKNLNKPTIVNYAGILTKEEAGTPAPLLHLFKQIELDFDRPNNFYVFPSKLTKREIEKIFRRKIKNSIVIPNGVAPEFFKEECITKKKNSIGFVGRAHPIKNIEFLISLARALDKKSSNYHILAVSEIKKDKEIRKKLEDRDIEIVPEMSTYKLRQFFMKMTVIVCPSHFETYGNVSLEAIATGTPALVSENMGVSEIFRDLGLTNLVLEDFSSAEKVLNKIIETTSLKIKEGTREQIKSYLHWDKIMNKYIKICEASLEAI
ncbi:MAG: glycosyltransferase family 4 protein [Candidatus Pacearchaeota archaeon]|nr:MAG: glycosyltransferase family 4 protein [Candidatus Pacearchaeota archaeon]